MVEWISFNNFSSILSLFITSWINDSNRSENPLSVLEKVKEANIALNDPSIDSLLQLISFFQPNSNEAEQKIIEKLRLYLINELSLLTNDEKIKLFYQFIPYIKMDLIQPILTELLDKITITTELASFIHENLNRIKPINQKLLVKVYELTKDSFKDIISNDINEYNGKSCKFNYLLCPYTEKPKENYWDEDIQYI